MPEPKELDDVVFAVMYTMNSQKVLNLPEIPGVYWLHETYFDLDLDAYFDEAS